MKWVKIVLDVMSPAHQSILDLIGFLSTIENIARIEITLVEFEQNVVDVKVTLEGYDLNYEEVREVVRDCGAVVRNVDNMVSAEAYISQDDHVKLLASILVLAYHCSCKEHPIDHVYDQYSRALRYLKYQRRKHH